MGEAVPIGELLKPIKAKYEAELQNRKRQQGENMTPLEKILGRLDGVKKAGKGYTALCPAHDDRNPSLSIREADDGRVLVHCHAGCCTEGVLGAVGYTMKDIMPESEGTPFDRLTGFETCQRVNVSTQYKTANEAIGSLNRGKPSKYWTYYNAELEPVSVVGRWDRDNGKDIRPVFKNGTGWRVGAMEAPRYLYQLPSIEESNVVFVVEGEKVAEALGILGLIATTSQGGSNAATKTDWTPLAGKEVVILPDNDEAGQRYASDVLDKLGQVEPLPRVKVVQLEGLPDKGDAFDYIAKYDQDPEACKVSIEQAVEATPYVELQAMVEEPVVPPFPTHALPEPLQEFVSRQGEALGCPDVFLALPVLAVTSTAIGNTYRVQVREGWQEPCIVWTLVVGHSGTMKTIAHEKAIEPLDKYQGEAFAEYENELRTFETMHEEWEQDNAKRKKNTTTFSVASQEPEEPTVERVVVSDTTMEALARTLSENPRGVLVDRDEASGWFESLNQYKAGGDDGSKFLELFRGKAFTVDRVTRKTLHVNKPFVSFCGTIQPSTLRRTMTKRNRDNGTMARFLITFPESPPKQWNNCTTSLPATEAYNQLIRGLLANQQRMDDFGKPEPTVVPLSEEAMEVFKPWFDKHNKGLQGQPENIRATWSKLEAYVPRLAMLFCLVREPATAPATVDVGSVQRAIEVVDWFKEEALRIESLVDMDEETENLQALVDLIRGNAGSMSPRELQRKGPRYGKTSRNAEQWLEKVVEAGYGRWENRKQERGPATKCVILARDSQNDRSKTKEVS